MTMERAMPYQSGLLGFLSEWWQFVAFVAAGIVAFVMGKERTRWRVDQLGDRVKDLDQRMVRLERQGNAEAVTLAEIKATLGGIKDSLAEMRDDLKGKADK